MKRNEVQFAAPAATMAADHVVGLVRQARLARGWTVAALAERARVSTATLKRIEAGSVGTSLGAWLSVPEPLGLLRLVSDMRDPASEALLDDTRAKRGCRRAASAVDLDF